MNTMLKDISDKKGTEIRKSRKDIASKKEAKARRHLIRGLMMGVVGMVCADALKLFRNMCQLQLTQFTLDELYDDKYRTGCSDYTNLKDGVGIVGTVFDIKTRNPIAGVRFSFADYSVSTLNAIVQTLEIVDGIVDATNISSEPFKTVMVIDDIELPVTITTPLLPAMCNKGNLEGVILDTLPDNTTLLKLMTLISEGYIVGVGGVMVNMYSALPWLYHNVHRLVGRSTSECNIIDVTNVSDIMFKTVRDTNCNDVFHQSAKIIKIADVLNYAKPNRGIANAPKSILYRTDSKYITSDISYNVVETDIGLFITVYDRGGYKIKGDWGCNFIYHAGDTYIVCVTVNNTHYLHTGVRNDTRIISDSALETIVGLYRNNEYRKILVFHYYSKISEEFANTMLAEEHAECRDGVMVPLSKNTIIPNISYHNVIENVVVIYIMSWGVCHAYFHNGHAYDDYVSFDTGGLPYAYVEDAIVKLHPLTQLRDWYHDVRNKSDLLMQLDVSVLTSEQLCDIFRGRKMTTHQTWVVSDTCAMLANPSWHDTKDKVYKKWQPEFAGCHTIVHVEVVDGVTAYVERVIEIDSTINNIPINACVQGANYKHNHAIVSATGELLFSVTSTSGAIYNLSDPSLKDVVWLGDRSYRTLDNKIFQMHDTNTLEKYTAPIHSMYCINTGEYIKENTIFSTILVMGIYINLHRKEMEGDIIGIDANCPIKISPTEHSVVLYDFTMFRMVYNDGWCYITAQSEYDDEDERNTEFNIHHHTYDDIIKRVSEFNRWNII